MKRAEWRISVIGLGYIGLCTAATFASRGFKTIGIDFNETRVEQIRNGKPPVFAKAKNWDLCLKPR